MTKASKGCFIRLLEAFLFYEIVCKHYRIFFRLSGFIFFYRRLSRERRENMAIKVFIKRKCPQDKQRELFRCIKEIRRLVPQQSGYISGEYLKSIDETNEIVTISSWFSLEDWQTWFESEERKKIQSKIDSIPGVTTEYSIYRYIKTR
jgi:heme-degrading monooxygenase HmoA